MKLARLGIMLVGAGLAWIAGSDRTHAQAVGFLHMPSTLAQYCGWGYGTGHHAPIVCTPKQRPEHAKRIVCAPHCYGPLGPAMYEPIRCYGSECQGAIGAPIYEPIAAAPGGIPVRQFAPVAPQPAPIAMRPTPFGWR